MTWKSRFINDTDNKHIGTCVAEWVDADVVIVSHQDRVDMRDSVAKINFAAAAQKLLDEKTARDADIAAKIAELDALLVVKQVPVPAVPPVVEPVPPVTPPVVTPEVRPNVRP